MICLVKLVSNELRAANELRFADHSVGKVCAFDRCRLYEPSQSLDLMSLSDQPGSAANRTYNAAKTLSP